MPEPKPLAERKRLKKLADRKAAAAEKAAKRPTCGDSGGVTKSGAPCQSRAVKPGGLCKFHSMTPEEHKEFSRRATAAGVAAARGRSRVRAVDLQRSIVESAASAILMPYFKALGVDYEVTYDEDGRPLVEITKADHANGLVLHGESKDGDIVMTRHPDLTGQVGVAEKLFDRVYGKPKQSHEIAGQGGGPVKVEVPRSASRAAEVARILAEAGGLPGVAGTSPVHEGRQRRLPPRRSAPASANGLTNGNGKGNGSDSHGA